MTGSSGGIERRQYKRRYIQFSVRYRFQAEGVITDWKESEAGNVSAGGLFMTFGEKLEVGRELELDFEVPGRDPPIHARGVIVWTRETVPGTMVECGLRFEALAAEDKDFLLRFAEEGPEAA